MQVEKCMLVSWCGSPVVLPGVGGGGAGRCLKPGATAYYRPPELFHLPPVKGKPRHQMRYADQVVSYEPLVHTMDLYRSNLMLNAPMSQKDLAIAMKCGPGRRHSHDQSDFNAELFNLNNLNKAKSCHNTPRKSQYTHKDESKSMKILKDSQRERRDSREELIRGRSILRRSSWYRRKPRPNGNLHRLSLPSLRDSSKQQPINNCSSTTDLTKSDNVKVRRSSTSVGDQSRRISANGYNMITGYISTIKDTNGNLTINNGTLRAMRSAKNTKRVSINLNEIVNSDAKISPSSSHDSSESLTLLKNKKNLDNGSCYSSSLSSSSSSGSCSTRHSSLQTRAIARFRGLQR